MMKFRPSYIPILSGVINMGFYFTWHSWINLTIGLIAGFAGVALLNMELNIDRKREKLFSSHDVFLQEMQLDLHKINPVKHSRYEIDDKLYDLYGLPGQKKASRRGTARR